MIKEIKYSGITANPSDYECPDGTIAASIGLINENSAMAPIQPSKTIIELNEGERIVYIHQHQTFKHYIIIDDNNNIKWCSNDLTSYEQIYTCKELSDIASIGYTLIILSDDSMKFFLWSEDLNNYKNLGEHLPELSLSFSLYGNYVKTRESFEVRGVYGEENRRYGINNMEEASEDVFSHVNSFISDVVLEQGYFLFPFFVRYAYRLYDGSSLVMHSAPILMTATTKSAPYVIGFSIEDGKMKECDVHAIIHDLEFAAIKKDEITALSKDWGDIVKSVDIFISLPIYTYSESSSSNTNITLGHGSTANNSSDENLSLGLFSSEADDFGYTICSGLVPVTGSTNQTKKLFYKKHDILNLIAANNNVNGGYYIKLPQKEDKILMREIEECSNFYFLKSYELSEISTDRKKVEIEKGYLKSLATKEVMTDDFDSHDILLPKSIFIYNSRLNAANLKKVLFKGYHAASILPYTNGGYQYKDNSGNVIDAFDEKETIVIAFHIKENGNIIKVYGGSQTFTPRTPITYLFYPNTKAFKAEICRVSHFGDTHYKFYEVPLKPHPMLNGAYYHNGWDDIKTTSTNAFWPDITQELNKNRLVEIPYKIYTSEAENPFVFPVTGINSVACGNIIVLSTISKPISEGQAGLFPLYAFTDEGVWALSVSDTGTYNSKQNIVRDIINNRDSILQMDESVLFATNRGIMLLSGSEVTCITDILNGNHFNTTTIIDEDKLNKLNTNALPLVNAVPFIDYIKGCRMVYDYKGQRIIVLNPEHSYAYVYSLKSKLWGMMQSNFTEAIPSYPETYVMTSDNKLINLSDTDEEATPPAQLLITRPLKLDHPDKLKTITTVIQRGQFQPGHVKQILYGSRDLTHWFPIWSSADHYLRGFTGTPYKYFRIVVIATLTKDEYLEGCTIEYNLRQTNMLR